MGDKEGGGDERLFGGGSVLIGSRSCLFGIWSLLGGVGRPRRDCAAPDGDDLPIFENGHCRFPVTPGVVKSRSISSV